MNLKNNQYENSIIKTLCYSDVFDYPLTTSEIYKYYIGKKSSSRKISSAVLTLIKKGHINITDEYLYLSGRKKLSALRKKRKKISSKKWKFAIQSIKLLSKIPTVKLIGISGSLSMENTSENDDVDLFIITTAGTLWLTRFLVNIILGSAKVKRGKNSLSSTNKICPNMFISQDNLKINENLFSAHEITQLKVLLNKDFAYEKFLSANEWVCKFLPNAISTVTYERYIIEGKNANKILSMIDRLFYIAQFIYMKRSITTEKVSKNSARFHPLDKTNFVQLLYKQRYQFYMKSFGVKDVIQPQNVGFSQPKVTPGY